MTTAFTNARLIDPASDLDTLGTLITADSRIAAIGSELPWPLNTS